MIRRKSQASGCDSGAVVGAAPALPAQLAADAEMAVHLGERKALGVSVVPAETRKDAGLALVREWLFDAGGETELAAPLVVVGNDVRHLSDRGRTRERLGIVAHARDISPRQQPQRRPCGLRRECQLEIFAASAAPRRLELLAVGGQRHQERAVAQRPARAHVGELEAAGVTARVRGEVPAGVLPQRPVQELDVRAAGVTIAVEVIVAPEQAGLEFEPRDRLAARQLILSPFDACDFGSERPHQPQVAAGDVHALRQRARAPPHDIAVGETAQAGAIAEAGTVELFGVQIQLRPVERRPAQVRAISLSRLPVAVGVQAQGTAVGGHEPGLGLVDGRQLRADQHRPVAVSTGGSAAAVFGPQRGRRGECTRGGEPDRPFEECIDHSHGLDPGLLPRSPVTNPPAPADADKTTAGGNGVARRPRAGGRC